MFYACASERDAVIKRFVGTAESVDTVVRYLLFLSHICSLVLNFLSISQDNLRRTPLFFHVERGNVNGCRMVLRHGANIFHKVTETMLKIYQI
jgi:DNA phosphorothioation-dependent restriction protein DptG